jgi:hypothetical protein
MHSNSLQTCPKPRQQHCPRTRPFPVAVDHASGHYRHPRPSQQESTLPLSQRLRWRESVSTKVGAEASTSSGEGPLESLVTRYINLAGCMVLHCSSNAYPPAPEAGDVLGQACDPLLELCDLAFAEHDSTY